MQDGCAKRIFKISHTIVNSEALQQACIINQHMIREKEQRKMQDIAIFLFSLLAILLMIHQKPRMRAKKIQAKIEMHKQIAGKFCLFKMCSRGKPAIAED